MYHATKTKGNLPSHSGIILYRSQNSAACLFSFEPLNIPGALGGKADITSIL